MSEQQTILITPQPAATEANANVSGNSTDVELIDNVATEHRAAAPSDPHQSVAEVPLLSPLRKAAVVTQLSGVNFTASVISGLVVIGLPTISKDLDLPESLSFWPSSVTNLATASTLLIAGAAADVLGHRTIDLAGCFIIGAFILGAGASKTGSGMVAMRAIQGIGMAMHLASSVGIVAETVPRGRSRNIAFSCLGFSQPLGFSVGLVLGGVLVDTIGWRAGWYIHGALTIALATIGLWALPKTKKHSTWRHALRDLRAKVDWTGALLASAFMSMFSYLLAILSTDINKIRLPESIVLLILSATALPAFITWMDRQVRHGRPALIPNTLWRNASFSSMCGIVVLSFAVLNSLELFASLFFQKVQHLSALQASIRILPSLVVGVLLNMTMGFMVDRIPAIWIVTISSILCAASPLLMALVQPQWPYWANAFVAQLFQPVSGDALFTVGLIIITDVFPEDTQALAGAVFNTASQIGNAIGLAIMQVVSTLVTKHSREQEDTQALLEGYRASFWTMFGLMILVLVWGSLGMRKTGRVGLKQD